MKSLEIKSLIAAFFVCFSVSTSQAQTEPRLVLPIGHTNELTSAVFSQDGKYAVTASRDNTARIYEVATGKEVQVLSGPANSSNSAIFSPKVSAIFSPSGKLVLTGSLGNTASIFDVSSGEQQHVLKHTNWIFSAVFSQDGKFALTAGNDNTARIFEVSSGKAIRVLKGHKSWIYSAVFSPDAKFVLTASQDHTARIYEVASGKEVQVLTGHTNYINSAVFSPDGKLALTASEDSTARIFDVSSGKEVQVLKGNAGMITSAVFSPDGKLVLTASHDARIYNVFNEEVLELKGHKGWINSAVFSPDGKFVLTAGEDKTARICDVYSGMELHVLKGHTSSINSALFSDDGKYAITASVDGTARIYEVSSGKENQVLGGHTSEMNTVVFSPEGKLSLSSSCDNIARICELSSGKQLQVLSGHTGSIASAVFSPDGKLALTASEDSTARIYELSSGKEVQVLKGITGSITSAVFSPNGNLVLTTSADTTARIYDVTSGKEVQVLKGHTRQLTSAVFSPNGNFALTCDDNDAHIYEVSSGNLVQVVEGSITSAVFSPNGKLLLTRSFGSDPTVIYEISSGKKLKDLKGHTDWVTSAVFSPDGKLALTASWDRTARIYDVASGKLKKVLKGHENLINSALFSPDNKTILTTAADHKTILWETATGKPLYTRLQLKDNDWLVYDEHYRFDGTPGAIEKLYFTCGLEVIELGQMKDALYVPGLASKIMNGEDINYQKLSDLDICEALPIIERTNENDRLWEFKIQQRRWPIVRLEVKVDGKTVITIPANDLKWDNQFAALQIIKNDLQKHFKSGEENKVTVIAITEFQKREFKSRGVHLELAAEGEKIEPNFYMLMIGVNDYKDDALDLRFPVQDARAFGSALESSARKLLGDGKVFVYNVQSKTENNTVYTTPEKAGVMKALEEIGKNAKTNDVLFIFFAGHGVMQGADNSFTFLTADASKLNPVGISTTDLKSWLSPEGPFHMMPNKTVLVYDACNSGQASKELADLAMARDDNATERQRQIEDLGDKSGVFILSASAPNQSAYELPHLGQGMLTYSLLTTLKNNPGVLDESLNGNGFLNLQKWFLETEREQSRLMQSLGLNQDAQPYGTANIRIGIVDDEVREGITLMAEKPLVYCTSARDDSEEDPLELKQAVNAFLETATSRGIANKLGFIRSETSQANILKLVYSKKGDAIECRILIFKNKLKINEININTSTTTAAEDVVKAVEGVIK